MAVTTDSFLPEIYESVNLIRDLIVKDQLPHYAAPAAVKEQLSTINGLQTNTSVADLFRAVQSKLEEQGLLPLPALTAPQGAPTVDRSVTSISFPSNADGESGRTRKSFRHATFESGIIDRSASVLSLHQMKAMTKQLLDFGRVHESHYTLPVSHQILSGVDDRRPFGGSDVSFDDNDYYSSQAESSASHPRRLRQPKDTMHGSTYPHMAHATVPIHSGADNSELSDDYTPPAAHIAISEDEDEDEYDPMQLEQESDYDPNDLAGSDQRTKKHTPIVTSRITQIEAPQPSRVSSHTVSKMSSLANIRNLQSPYDPRIPPKNSPGGSHVPHIVNASHTRNEQGVPLLDNTLQQLSQATANLSHGTASPWGAVLQQLASQPATSAADSEARHPNTGGMPNVSAQKPNMSKAQRKQKQREERRAATLARREKKRERRRTEENDKNGALDQGEHAVPPPLTQTQPQHAVNAAPAPTWQSLLGAPQIDRAVAPSVVYGQQPAVAMHRPGTIMPAQPGMPPYGLAYPGMAATGVSQFPGAAHVQIGGALVPVMPGAGQPRVLGPAEMSFVRDQYGNVYLAQPIVAQPAQVYGYPHY